MFCWVFIAEEIDGVGDKGLGDTTTVDVHILLEDFVNIYLRSACFTDEPFSSKKQNFHSWANSIQGPEISELSDIRLKEFCCILKI